MPKDITPKAMRCAIGTCPGLYDVTPAEMRCAIAAACPALVEVTPEAMACSLGISCPGLHEVTPEAMACLLSQCPGLHETPPMPGFESGGVIVIGKIHDVTALVKHRIGPDEFAVVVPKALLKNIQWSEED